MNKFEAAANVIITMIEKHPESKEKLLKIINNYPEFNNYFCFNLSFREWETVKELVNNNFMEV